MGPVGEYDCADVEAAADDERRDVLQSAVTRRQRAYALLSKARYAVGALAAYGVYRFLGCPPAVRPALGSDRPADRPAFLAD